MKDGEPMNHQPPPDHVILNGEWFDSLAWANRLEVELPEGAGWATALLGSHRICKWLDVPRMVAVDGGFDEARAMGVES